MALIKCPDCGTEVSSVASSCLKCGRPISPPKAVQPKKKSSGCAIALLVLIILAGVGVILGGKDEPNTTGSTSSPTPQINDALPQKKVTEITAQQLFEAYNNNEVATDDAITGTDVAVTGRVQEIAKDFTDAVVINFATSNEFMPARMTMEDSEREQAATLRPGDTVTILCHRMHRIMGSPSGRKCVFSQLSGQD